MVTVARAPQTPSQRRFELGAMLAVVAIVVTVAAFIVWHTETQDAHEQGITDSVDVTPDHNLPVAMGAVSAVLFLSGVIVMATVPPEPPAKKKAKA